MASTEWNFGFFPDVFTGFETSRVIVLPVPFDQTSTWIRGAEKGPAAIVESSINFEWYDIETGWEPYRIGIHTDRPIDALSNPAAMVEAVYHRVGSHLAADKFVVLLGGEHSVSIGSFRAHAEKYPNLTILQLDAHADLRPDYHNSPLNHACAMARAREVAPIVQVGLRSMDIDEKEYLAPDRVFFAHQIVGHTDWMDAAVEQLTEDVYLTIDLDVFDPSIMPATGTPEPGGLGWYETLAFLRKVAQSRRIVGFDVVELCPTPGNHAAVYLAARLVYKLLAYIFKP
jgi:agmatinase